MDNRGAEAASDQQWLNESQGHCAIHKFITFQKLLEIDIKSANSVRQSKLLCRQQHLPELLKLRPTSSLIHLSYKSSPYWSLSSPSSLWTILRSCRTQIKTMIKRKCTIHDVCLYISYPSLSGYRVWSTPTSKFSRCYIYLTDGRGRGRGSCLHWSWSLLLFRWNCFR